MQELSAALPNHVMSLTVRIHDSEKLGAEMLIPSIRKVVESLQGISISP